MSAWYSICAGSRSGLDINIDVGDCTLTAERQPSRHTSRTVSDIYKNLLNKLTKARKKASKVSDSKQSKYVKKVKLWLTFKFGWLILMWTDPCFINVNQQHKKCNVNQQNEMNHLLIMSLWQTLSRPRKSKYNASAIFSFAKIASYSKIQIWRGNLRNMQLTSIVVDWSCLLLPRLW